ncbi:MAG: hypothetical protein K0R61_4926 [Microvirga sp.]|jgi:hypothetical protein|nr:hypothetical protein [Microvirga sp.]
MPGFPQAQDMDLPALGTDPVVDAFRAEPGV